jgi:hypothetical protein
LEIAVFHILPWDEFVSIDENESNNQAQKNSEEMYKADRNCSFAFQLEFPQQGEEIQSIEYVDKHTQILCFKSRF